MQPVGSVASMQSTQTTRDQLLGLSSAYGGGYRLGTLSRSVVERTEKQGGAREQTAQDGREPSGGVRRGSEAQDAGKADQPRKAGDEENQTPAEQLMRKMFDRNECQTCKRRRYQDGSNDPGVSFKTPQRIAPAAVPSAVRAHEMEHVFREQAKAQREDREVVSQSVALHTGICPECGRVYISGGTTRTTTRDKSRELAEILQNESAQDA